MGCHSAQTRIGTKGLSMVKWNNECWLAGVVNMRVLIECGSEW